MIWFLVLMIKLGWFRYRFIKVIFISWEVFLVLENCNVLYGGNNCEEREGVIKGFLNF